MMKLVLTIHTLWTHLDCWYSCNWSRSHSHSFAMSFESLQSSQMADLWSLTHILWISLGFPCCWFWRHLLVRKPSGTLQASWLHFPSDGDKGPYSKIPMSSLGRLIFVIFPDIYIYNIYIRCILCIYCKNSRQRFDLKKTKQTQYPSGILRFTSNPLVAAPYAPASQSGFWCLFCPSIHLHASLDWDLSSAGWFCQRCKACGFNARKR